MTRLTDIYPTSDRVLYRFQEANGRLYFRADDGATGMELWTSDGTEAGTGLLKDIAPGATRGFTSFTIRGSAVNEGAFLFAAGTVGSDGTEDSELWKTDGTEAGTVLVKDIRPGPLPSYISGMTRLGNTVFFSADNGTHGKELWKSDGTAAGTVMVKDLYPGAGSNPGSFTVAGNKLFFSADTSAGGELWVTDGTATGTRLVKDIVPGPGGGIRSGLTAAGSTVFFLANDGTTGQELWKSDGTAAGTVMVKDLYPGNAVQGAFAIVGAVDGTLYFVGNDGVHGKELWKTDGTAAGTVMVKDFYPGSASSSFSGHSRAWNGELYFGVQADGSLANFRRHELWKTDGTPEGTVFLLNPMNASFCISYTCPQSYEFLGELNGMLYFAAGTGSLGHELWKTDGTPEGSTFVMDVEPGSASGVNSSEGVALLNGSLYFVNSELWRITPQACP